jgi:threonine aldolase
MIDLRSDTLTKPTPAMRKAMAEAAVGDDVYGEDPTVNKLETFSAERLAKDAGLFLPSGTMANLIAFLTQARPGDSVLLSAESHPLHYEGGNLAAFGGLLTQPLPDPGGKLSLAAVEAAIMQIDDPHFARTTIMAIENTTNRGGGSYYTPSEVEALGAVAWDRDIAFHCDGARLFNAAVAQDVDPIDLVAPCHTACFCLSKGLGAPVGSVLVGNRELIHRARRYRKMLGGGMRQAGMLAAAGLHALEYHVDDLKQDHERATWFREELEEKGFHFARPTWTNIAYLHVAEPFSATAALAEGGVLVLPHDADQIRVVFHRDVTDDDTVAAARIIVETLEPASPA